MWLQREKIPSVTAHIRNWTPAHHLVTILTELPQLLIRHHDLNYLGESWIMLHSHYTDCTDWATPTPRQTSRFLKIPELPRWVALQWEYGISYHLSLKLYLRNDMIYLSMTVLFVCHLWCGTPFSLISVSLFFLSNVFKPNVSNT
jgi:hypothetical protein